jgi:hypothetical protein
MILASTILIWMIPTDIVVLESKVVPLAALLNQQVSYYVHLFEQKMKAKSSFQGNSPSCDALIASAHGERKQIVQNRCPSRLLGIFGI